MRALVVDDEPVARRVLRRLLRDDAEILEVLECGSGEAARALLEQHDFDVAFFDIQMPGISGLEVLAEAGECDLPAVVFVTAHEQYALRAIEVGAADYLLKPFSEERFAQALERAKTRRREASLLRRSEEFLQLLASARGDRPATHPAEKISVQEGAGMRFVDVADICWVEADDKHVVLHLDGPKVVRARKTLAELEQQLDPKAFFRVHRSCLVSRDGVRELGVTDGGAAFLEMRDGARVAVSRSRLSAVRSWCRR